MRRIFLVALIALLALSIAAAVYCADGGKASPVATQARRPMPPQLDKNFVFILGSISKIDASDPNNIKLEVLNEADNTNHIIAVGPGTTALKVVDISDLKVNEKVRIMARKTENKEVAMSVVTGKIKENKERWVQPKSAAVPAEPKK